ncbi:MAG: RNA polymerase sigma factor [Saprospiraceae bacterium]
MKNNITFLYQEINDQNIEQVFNAFTKSFYENFYPKILAYCKKLNYQKLYSGEDLAQDTFLKFFDMISIGKKYSVKTEEDFLKILIQIAKRLSIDAFRKKANQELSFEDNLDSFKNKLKHHPTEHFENQEDIQLLKKRLSPKDWEIFELKSQGFKQKEIAEKLKISLKTVQRSINLIRKEFKETFGVVITKKGYFTFSKIKI